jgi:hypothetical protein
MLLEPVLLGSSLAAYLKAIEFTGTRVDPLEHLSVAKKCFHRKLFTSENIKNIVNGL